MRNPYPTKVDCKWSLPCDYLLPCWGGPDREGSNTHLSHQESGHEGICALRPTPAREMVGHEEPPTMTYSFCVGMVSDDYSFTHPPPHGGVCEGIGPPQPISTREKVGCDGPPIKGDDGWQGSFHNHLHKMGAGRWRSSQLFTESIFSNTTCSFLFYLFILV